MTVLDNVKEIQRLDVDGMYERIIHLPEQVLKAYNEAIVHVPADFLIPGTIKKVMFSGMGGSAISGDLAASAFGAKFPVEVVKNYLPPYVDNETLLIAISYSGNTEETLSCVEEARRRGAFIAAITSGGKLKDSLLPNEVWVEVPAGFPPRSAIGYLFFSALRLLETYEMIESQQDVVKAIVAMLIKKAGAIADSVPEDRNIAKLSAKELQGKIPVVYASRPELLPVAYRWKCQLNENAKYPAFSHTLPEMNHNEIEGWEHPELRKQLFPIFLQNLQEDENYLKRIRAMQALFTRDNVPSQVFYTEGESLLEQMFSLIYLGDMISFYLAILDGTDPTGINYINYLKSNI